MSGFTPYAGEEKGFSICLENQADCGMGKGVRNQCLRSWHERKGMHGVAVATDRGR